MINARHPDQRPDQQVADISLLPEPTREAMARPTRAMVPVLHHKTAPATWQNEQTLPEIRRPSMGFVRGQDNASTSIAPGHEQPCTTTPGVERGTGSSFRAAPWRLRP